MDKIERDQYEVVVLCKGMRDIFGNPIDADFIPASGIAGARDAVASVLEKYPDAHGSIKRVVTGWKRGNRLISTVPCESF